MKRMWARVGYNFDMTDEEYEQFLKMTRSGTWDDAKKMIIQLISSGKAQLSGESYFPEQGCFGDDETSNVEELTFLF